MPIVLQTTNTHNGGQTLQIGGVTIQVSGNGEVHSMSTGKRRTRVRSLPCPTVKDTLRALQPYAVSSYFCLCAHSKLHVEVMECKTNAFRMPTQDDVPVAGHKEG